ncbi:ABC transporter permease [Spiroplasma endosymbiont of Polydrusus formosus]|uniref:ABC transporter permease n=1 Tax=Spiroplasma endosymbiont of Polydrusus formosus TaxID=3139326 RepID=UPI0035B566BC
MGNKMLKKGKSNSWWSIISFSIFKIRRSMSVWALLLLSIVLFGAITVTLFLSSKDVNEFLKNFQYAVFIFNNILLLLFVLLVIIKIFGREFEDGTYLLLISKPYSRFALFLLKLISIWVLIILFLVVIVLFAFCAGYIGSLFKQHDTEYFQVYQNLLLKLFIYSLILSFFASNGILFAITFLNSQIVLLIVVIFCSLFLVGGVPYSLIVSLTNNIDLSFDNESIVKQNYPVKIIKDTINFKRKLEQKLIKYDKLTNEMWNFYSQYDYDVLKKVFDNADYQNITDDSTLRIQRLEFYKSLDLIKTKESEYEIDGLQKWDSTTKYNYGGKDSTVSQIISSVGTQNFKMKVHFATDYFFKAPSELDPHNNIHKELLDFINVIGKKITWFSYFRINSFNGTSLFYFNLDKSYYNLSSKNNDPKIVTVDRKLSESNSFNPVSVFKAEFDRMGVLPIESIYNNGDDFQKWIFIYFGIKNSDDLDFDNENDFVVKTLYVLREIELDIVKKIMDYKLLELIPLKTNNAWQKYNDLMKTYSLISKLNIIEHWNQIWTSLLSYVPFWFTPIERSNIDFTVQNNYLMSYQDFSILLDITDKKVNLYPPPLLNINLLLYIYLGISGLFLINSYLILRRKNIT